LGSNEAISIIFLVEPFSSPSTRFRVLQNIPELEALNFNVTVREIPRSIGSRLRLINTLSSYDIVLLQRKLFQWWFLRYIRAKSKILIYDFDDAVLFRDSNAPHFHSGSRLKRFRHTVKYADLVISGNQYLKDLCLPYATNVSVISTGIDTDAYVQKLVPNPSSSTTIGWIGSQPNLIYLKQLAEPINALYRAIHNFRLKIVCDDFIQDFECPVENKLWKREDEVGDIQSFDIGVFPLPDDRWTKGKCAMKLIQYMSCAVPSVSSANDVTSAIVNDGFNGFLASNASQWIEKLKFLVENPDKRAAIGAEGRRSIAGRFDTKTIARNYAKLFVEAVRSYRGRRSISTK
jgi:hypothetical protein